MISSKYIGRIAVIITVLALAACFAAIAFKDKISEAAGGNTVKLDISMNNLVYDFSVTDGENTKSFGFAHTRYVSTEVAGGFTGVVFGLYSQGENGKAGFTDFECSYE